MLNDVLTRTNEVDCKERTKKLLLCGVQSKFDWGGGQFFMGEVQLAPVFSGLLLIKLHQHYNLTSPVLCLHNSLAEIEEYQLQIASNEEVMRQTFSVALTPTFKFGPSMVAIGTLDNLSSQ